MARSAPLFTQVSTLVAVAVLFVLVTAFWELLFSALGVFLYAVWQAVRYQDPSHLWSLPLRAATSAWRMVAELPGYVWAALLVVAWLEWRLARLEQSIHTVARAVRRLGRRRRSGRTDATARPGDVS